MFMGGPCRYFIFSSLVSSSLWQQRETYFSEWAVGIICFAAAVVQLRIYWIPPLSKVFSSSPLPPSFLSSALQSQLEGAAAAKEAFENKVIGKMRLGTEDRGGRTAFCLSVKLPRLTKRRPFFLGSVRCFSRLAVAGGRERERGPHTPELKEGLTDCPSG